VTNVAPEKIKELIGFLFTLVSEVVLKWRFQWLANKSSIYFKTTTLLKVCILGGK